MSSDYREPQKHVAMPKLMGAPAYARPRRLVETAPRPIDPDDLPLESHRTPEEHELATAIVQATESGAVAEGAEGESTPTDERPRSIVSRLGLRRG